MSASLLTTGILCMPVLAKEKDDKKIGAVKLTVKADYSAGDEADSKDFEVTSPTDGVSVDSIDLMYEMASREEGEWSKYDTPILVVDLTAEDGYYFDKAGSKSGWSFTGENATFMSSSVSSDKYEVELKIMVESLKGEIGNPYNLGWRGNSIAYWTKGYKNTRYKVELYHEDDKVIAVETKETAYDFRDNMHKEGNYYFSVQGIKGDNSTDFVDSSTIYISDVQAAELASANADNSSSNLNNVTSNGQKEGSSQSNNAVIDSSRIGWYQYTDGTWYYIRSNGSKAMSNWEKIDNKWYMFDASGRMLTGLQSINGVNYYLASSGEMLTGWQFINGTWYYFNENGMMAKGWVNAENKWYLLGESGEMMTGWQKSGESWYYLDANGAMKTGWFTDTDGKVYFFLDSGVMAIGDTVAQGVPHTFAESGELLH